MASADVAACYGAATGYSAAAPSRWTGLAASRDGLARISWPRAQSCRASNTTAATAFRCTCSHSKGQERVVASLLAREDGSAPRGLVFLEMGGGEGIRESNTFPLEACLGWRGVLVEPNPNMHRRICTNRPRALSYGVAVCAPPARTMAFDVSRKANSVEQWATAGAPELLNEESRLVHERAAGRVRHLRVPCAPLGALLRNVLPHIDYLSLDVEGGEAVVLGTFDWARTSVHLLGVEQSATALEKNAKVRAQLTARGFVHVHTHWVWEPRLADEFFLNGTYLRSHLPRVAAALDGLHRMPSAAKPMAERARAWSARIERSSAEAVVGVLGARMLRKPPLYARG